MKCDCNNGGIVNVSKPPNFFNFALNAVPKQKILEKPEFRESVKSA